MDKKTQKIYILKTQTNGATLSTTVQAAKLQHEHVLLSPSFFRIVTYTIVQISVVETW